MIPKYTLICNTVSKFKNILDTQDWFYAAEAFHFGRYLTVGKSRFIESLYLPESAILLQTEEWNCLLQELGSSDVLGMFSVRIL